MINAHDYKTVSDNLGEIQRDGLNMYSSIGDMLTHLQNNEVEETNIQKRDLLLEIQNEYDFILLHHSYLSDSMIKTVQALQKHVETHYGSVNDFLKDTETKVSKRFTDLSGLCGYPIDIDNIRTDTQAWVYTGITFYSDHDVDDSIILLNQAAALGYTHWIVDCAQIKYLTSEEDPNNGIDKLGYGTNWVTNYRRFRTAAQASGIKLIVGVPGVGEGSPVNLAFTKGLGCVAEGIPVTTEFEVTGGNLVPIVDLPTGLNDVPMGNLSWDSVHIAGGKLVPDGWGISSGAGVVMQTAITRLGAGYALQLIESGGVSFESKTKKLKYYHVSLWIKAEDWPSNTLLTDILTCVGQAYYDGVLVGNYITQTKLSFPAGDTDWTQIHLTFCTLDYERVDIIISPTIPAGSTLWIDDMAIEQAGITNIIRRDSTPITFVTYHETADIINANDPDLENMEYWHGTGMPYMTAAPGGLLIEGDHVTASYYVPAIRYGVWIDCPSENSARQIVADIINNVHDIMAPDGYYIRYDEIRVGGWDPLCVAAGGCGPALADNVRYVISAIKHLDPDKIICTWDDMFDPYALAGSPRNYMNAGPYTDSWLGLSSDIVIMNWDGGDTDAARFFSDLNLNQILSMDVHQIFDHGFDVDEWINDVSIYSTSVIGGMYTSWLNDYTHLSGIFDYIQKIKYYHPENL